MFQFPQELKDRTKMSGINHRYSSYNATLKENIACYIII